MSEHLRPYHFKPGQSGNPAGYSRSRRITDALIRIIENGDVDQELANAILASALGKRVKDPKTGKFTKPSLPWMQLLLERVEGKVTQSIEVNAPAPETIAPHAIPDADPRELASDGHPPLEGDPDPDAPA